MNQKEREKANKYQILIFLNGLHPPWRLFSIRGMLKMFEDYDAFYSNIIVKPFTMDDHKKQVKHGLTYQAVAETMQYIEDLFSFMMTSKNIDTLIKDVLFYSPSAVGKYIGKFERLSDEQKLDALKMPYFCSGEAWENVELWPEYNKFREIALSKLERVIAFHKRYYRFYLQYKHGLKAPLNPGYDNEQHEVFAEEVDLWRYEQFDYWKDNGHAELYTPPLHPNIEPFVDELQNEGNLLCCAADSVGHKEIGDIAFATYQLLTCLHYNFVGMLLSDDDLAQELSYETTPGVVAVWFPSDDTEHPFTQIDFPYPDDGEQ